MSRKITACRWYINKDAFLNGAMKNFKFKSIFKAAEDFENTNNSLLIFYNHSFAVFFQFQFATISIVYTSVFSVCRRLYKGREISWNFPLVCRYPCSSQFFASCIGQVCRFRYVAPFIISVFCVFRTCPCGQTSQNGRCGTTPICENTCGRLLNCQVHSCQEKCHKGISKKLNNKILDLVHILL